MIAASSRTRQARTRQAGAKPRRGVALVFVLIFVVAMAALAMSSIFMASNSTLLAKSYDKERSLKYAAEVALQIGKSRVNSDPTVLQLAAGQLYNQIMTNEKLYGADSKPLPGDVKVSVYVGRTGSTSGQSGRFSSIVAHASDGKRNAFIRRLELAQESFAKFAYWSNKESNGGGTIYFGGGDELWGPVWSNDDISIASSGATFHDNVATAQTISGKSDGKFEKGYLEKQKPIALPPVTTLANLKGYAALGGFDFSSSPVEGPNTDPTDILDRIEFIAYNMPGGFSDQPNDDYEGFFRRYTAKTTESLRADWTFGATAATTKQCGDWHYIRSATPDEVAFFPASVHNTTWARDSIYWGLRGQLLWNDSKAKAYADPHKTADLAEIFSTVTQGRAARCYLAGDPHLVSIERYNFTGYTKINWEKGGTDTTFTPEGNLGKWAQYSTTPDTQVKRVRRDSGGSAVEANYLFPLGRKYNNSAKGVIYEKGNIGISGVLNGSVTMYAKGSIVFLDDLKYANDPSSGKCHDILGLITDLNAIVAQNTLLQPTDIDPDKDDTDYRYLDETKDFYLQAVIMALKTSFTVENFGDGPKKATNCEGDANGRGCLYLAGGIIQESRGAVGQLSGEGFIKRYSYDRCAVVNPPPYFPTTGRFTENRFIELDPQGFSPDAYFKTLDPNP